MRRFVPVLIVIIGVLALVIDFWPGLKLPEIGNPDGGTRTVETKLGLDLSGGLRVEYQALPAGGKTPTSGDLNTIRDIVERRVNATGVSEPLVQTQGSDRIVVEIPGVSDPDSIRKLIGSTGRLDFVPLPTARFGSNTSPGPESATAGQPLPGAALPPLFSGDQISGAVDKLEQLITGLTPGALQLDWAGLLSAAGAAVLNCQGTTTTSGSPSGGPAVMEVWAA